MIGVERRDRHFAWSRSRTFARFEARQLEVMTQPDAAAAAAFIIATSAEDAALRTATGDDLPGGAHSQPRARAGTKTDKRNRFVPIISDEQWILLDFVRRHAQTERSTVRQTV